MLGTITVLLTVLVIGAVAAVTILTTHDRRRKVTAPINGRMAHLCDGGCPDHLHPYDGSVFLV